MTFLVCLESPGRGSYALGTMYAPDKRSAQRVVIENLVEAGLPREKIGIYVSGEMLEIGSNKIIITPMKEFSSQIASTLIALL